MSITITMLFLILLNVLKGNYIIASSLSIAETNKQKVFVSLSSKL